MWRVVTSRPALVLLALTGVLNVVILLTTNGGDATREQVDCNASPSEMLDKATHWGQRNSSEHHANDDVWMNLKPRFINIVAKRRRIKGFLTIGIPSIRRANGMVYLNRTIASIIAHTDALDRQTALVVVLLADSDVDYNRRTSAALERAYRPYVTNGFLHLVQASPASYPPLDHLRQNFRDDTDRVKWRAKQVADYALLFLYARGLSRFYLQLEDDVESTNGFVTAIAEFVRNSPPGWAVLEFSELGFIGKLVRSSHLLLLARFMSLFYQQQPVDFLLRHFRMSMAQRGGVRMRKPTLFQHFGVRSSLDGSRDNPLKDRFYAGGVNADGGGDGSRGVKRWRGDDPAAAVFSTMPHHGLTEAGACYGSRTGVFWVTTALMGDTLTVVFARTTRVGRVVVETGDAERPEDLLDDGVVELAPARDASPSDAKPTPPVCGRFRAVARFAAGRVDVRALNATCKCVRVRVTDAQTHWVLFQQIAVFVVH